MIICRRSPSELSPHSFDPFVMNAAVVGDGDQRSRQSTRKIFQHSSVLDFPVACFRVPPESFNLFTRSYSFPVFRKSTQIHLTSSPESPPILRVLPRKYSSGQQLEQKDDHEIVEVSSSSLCRRSRSLRELFDAEELPESDFIIHEAHSSGNTDFFSDFRKPSPVSVCVANRSSSSRRVTLQNLLQYSKEEGNPRRSVRTSRREKLRLFWKSSIQSMMIRANGKNQAKKVANLKKKDKITHTQEDVLPNTHEKYYISRRTAEVRQRKRTYLPYKEHLISFFCCTR